MDTMKGIKEDLKIEGLAFFKYTTLTSVDVERHLSCYNNLLSGNRRSFKFDQIKKKKTFVFQCNTHIVNWYFITKKKKKPKK